MICPSCNKFAAYNTDNDPEIELQIEGGQVTGTVRIYLTSECCGDELKETTFDVGLDLEEEITDAIVKAAEEAKVPIKNREKIDLESNREEECEDNFGQKSKHKISLDISGESGEITDRSESTTTKTLKSGKVVTRRIPHRYQRRYFGASITFNVDIEYPHKGKLLTAVVEGTWQDECQASGMDQLV